MSSSMDSSDERELIQRKTFLNWVNMYLRSAKPPIKLNRLEELGDGVCLPKLMEKLLSKDAGKRIRLKTRRNPRSRIHIQNNIATALEAAQVHGMTVTASAQEFLPPPNFRPNMVLGFLWQLILTFQLKASGKGKAQLQLMIQELVDWINATTAEHPTGQLTTLKSRDLADGRVMALLVHCIDPGALPASEIEHTPESRLLAVALAAAEEHLGVPAMVNAVDIRLGTCGQKEIVTYLSTFRSLVTDHQPSFSGSTSESDRGEDTTHESDSREDDAMQALLEQKNMQLLSLQETLSKLQGQMDSMKAEATAPPAPANSHEVTERSVETHVLRPGVAQLQPVTRRVTRQLKEGSDPNTAKLVEWAHVSLAPYRDATPLSSRTELVPEDWVDGNDLAYLVHHVDNRLIDEDKVPTLSARERADLALTTAQERLYVEPEFTASENASGRVNEADLATYLQRLRDEDDRRNAGKRSLEAGPTAAVREPVQQERQLMALQAQKELRKLRDIEDLLQRVQSSMYQDQGGPARVTVLSPEEESAVRKLAPSSDLDDIVARLRSERADLQAKLDAERSRASTLSDQVRSMGPGLGSGMMGQHWYLRLNEVWLAKGRKTRYEDLAAGHAESKELETQYRDFTQQLEALFEHLEDLKLQLQKPGAPSPDQIEVYQARLAKTRSSVKRAKNEWVRTENGLGALYKPKTVVEVELEALRIRLESAVRSADVDTAANIATDLEAVRKLLIREARLHEQITEQRAATHRAKLRFMSTLHRKRSKLLEAYYVAEQARLYATVDHVAKGGSLRHGMATKWAALEALIESESKVNWGIPDGSQHLVDQLLVVPVAHIEKRYLSKANLYGKRKYQEEHVRSALAYADQGYALDLSNVNDPFVLAGIVKAYLENMEIPLAQELRDIPVKKDTLPSIKTLEGAIVQLPLVRRLTLAALVKHLAKVARRSQANHMGAQSLALVFGPLIMRS